MFKVLFTTPRMKRRTWPTTDLEIGETATLPCSKYGAAPSIQRYVHFYARLSRKRFTTKKVSVRGGVSVAVTREPAHVVTQ